MDPDVLLVDLRDALKEARSFESESSRKDPEIAAWQEVGTYIEDLDEWLSKGGYVPGEWRQR